MSKRKLNNRIRVVEIEDPLQKSIQCTAFSGRSVAVNMSLYAFIGQIKFAFRALVLYVIKIAFLELILHYILFTLKKLYVFLWATTLFSTSYDCSMLFNLKEILFFGIKPQKRYDQNFVTPQSGTVAAFSSVDIKQELLLFHTFVGYN